MSSDSNDRADVLVIVALGANLGEARETLWRAMGRLAALSDSPLRCSSLWRSAPVDCPPCSPDFVNAVVAFDARPDETPESLLRQLQSLEREFGRPPKRQANEPRPLDLDLIAFGQQVRDTEFLRLPHPRAPERRFVLAPLAELLPELQPPGWPAPVGRLLAELPPGPPVERIARTFHGSRPEEQRWNRPFD